MSPPLVAPFGKRLRGKVQRWEKKNAGLVPRKECATCYMEMKRDKEKIEVTGFLCRRRCYCCGRENRGVFKGVSTSLIYTLISRAVSHHALSYWHRHCSHLLLGSDLFVEQASGWYATTEAGERQRIRQSTRVALAYVSLASGKCFMERSFCLAIYPHLWAIIEAIVEKDSSKST